MSHVELTSDVLIGLGSNLGDRAATLQHACDQLRQDPRVQLTAVSSMYSTAPVGGPEGQGIFLNAVARLRTALSPTELLTRLRQIEQAAGRVRGVRWGERTLDLDLLLFGRCRCRSAGLIIPHPRMAFRRFVLEPAVEIAADMLHVDTGRTLEQLLAGIDRLPLWLAIATTDDDSRVLARQVAQALDAVWLPDPLAEVVSGPDQLASLEFLRKRQQAVREGLVAAKTESRPLVSTFWPDQFPPSDPRAARQWREGWHQLPESIQEPTMRVFWLESVGRGREFGWLARLPGNVPWLALQRSVDPWQPTSLNEIVAAAQSMAPVDAN